MEKTQKKKKIYIYLYTHSSFQLLSHVWLFPSTCTAARQACPSITSSRSLLKLMSIESGMPSNHRILCHPLLLPPSIFPSIRVFSNESVLHIGWPKFQLQHQSFPWIFTTDFLWDGPVGSPCCPRDSQESSPTPWLYISHAYMCKKHNIYGITQSLCCPPENNRIVNQVYVNKFFFSERITEKDSIPIKPWQDNYNKHWKRKRNHTLHGTIKKCEIQYNGLAF